MPINATDGSVQHNNVDQCSALCFTSLLMMAINPVTHNEITTAKVNSAIHKGSNNNNAHQWRADEGVYFQLLTAHHIALTESICNTVIVGVPSSLPAYCVVIIPTCSVSKIKPQITMTPLWRGAEKATISNGKMIHILTDNAAG